MPLHLVTFAPWRWPALMHGTPRGAVAKARHTPHLATPDKLGAARLAAVTSLLVSLLPSICHGETLEQLIAAALLAHPSIVAQQSQMEAAQAGVDSAHWQFFPTPSIAVDRAGASATDPSYPGSKTVTTVQVQQPLWTGGRLTAGMNRAKAGVLASQAALDDTREQLALRVVQAYGDWLGNHLKTLANEQSLQTHTRLYQQVERRIGQGASSDSDLLLAVGRLKAVTADIEFSRSQQEIALARLGQLLGRPIDDAALKGTPADPRPFDGKLQTLLDRALALDPGIQKSQAQVKIQETDIAARRAALAPEVYARFERQYGNHSFPDAAPENRLFIGLSSHFGAGLSSLSDIRGAQAQYQAALADVEVQSRAVSERMLADYASASASKSRMEALAASLDSAKQVAQSYDRQFLAGRKSWLDVMNAARELTQTEVQMADIEAAQVVVTWRLAISTQGVPAIVGGKP